MNKFLALALGLGILLLECYRPGPAHAQQWLPGGQGIPIVCAYNASPASVSTGQFVYAQCDLHGQLLGTGGGGGGGLSVVDQSPFTAGTSPFTPGGCQFNSAAQTLTSGTSGMAACDNHRAYEVNCISADNLCTILQSPLPVLGSGATGGQTRATINCDLHVFKHIITATDTLLVQGVASQTIYICGVEPKFAGTATVFLENTASVNANCSSTLTQIAGVYTGAANNFPGFYSNFWGGLKNTGGNGLCVQSTGTGGVDLDVWYAQL